MARTLAHDGSRAKSRLPVPGLPLLLTGVPCAAQGRLTHLFVEDGPIRWGSYESETGRIIEWEGYRDGAEELVNLACIDAYLGRARIYSFAAGELRSAGGIAGLCRT